MNQKALYELETMNLVLYVLIIAEEGKLICMSSSVKSEGFMLGLHTPLPQITACESAVSHLKPPQTQHKKQEFAPISADRFASSELTILLRVVIIIYNALAVVTSVLRTLCACDQHHLRHSYSETHTHGQLRRHSYVR